MIYSSISLGKWKGFICIYNSSSLKWLMQEKRVEVIQMGRMSPIQILMMLLYTDISMVASWR